MARLLIVVAVLACLSVVASSKILVGGLKEVDPNSQGAKNALAFALYEFNKRSNDAFQARPVKINKVEEQVVSGKMYYIDVDIARTECRKPTADTNSCKFHTDPALAKTSTCNFKVYSVPWEAKTELTDYHCN